MRILSRLVPLLLSLLPLCAAPALAEVSFKNFSEVRVTGELAPEASANSYALIVANSDYSAVGLGSLPVTENDARAMENLFLSMGYPEENVVRLSNLGRDAMIAEVYGFAARLKPEATVVIYYSGHGVTFAGDNRNYIVPVDMRASVDLPDNAPQSLVTGRAAAMAVQLERDVIDVLRTADPGGIVVFYDACRNIPAVFNPSRRKSLDAGSSFTPAKIRGTAVFYSARRGQESIASLGPSDDVHMSLFTRVLVSELSANPSIRLRDLHPLLNGRVSDLALEGTGGRTPQDPSLEADLDYRHSERREFCLASVMRDGVAICSGQEGPQGAGQVVPAAQPVAPGPDPTLAERAFWNEQIVKFDTRFHYQLYIDTYGTAGIYHLTALQAIARIEAEEAARAEADAAAQEAAALRAAQEAQRIDREAWLEARAADVPDAYMGYLHRFPRGDFVEEAKARMAELAQPALPEGRFFLIMGSYPKSERAKAEARLAELRSLGLEEASLADTDRHSRLTDGLYAVVVGPTSESHAKSLLPRARQLLGQAYVKAGD